MLAAVFGMLHVNKIYAQGREKSLSSNKHIEQHIGVNLQKEHLFGVCPSLTETLPPLICVTLGTCACDDRAHLPPRCRARGAEPGGAPGEKAALICRDAIPRRTMFSSPKQLC